MARYVVLPPSERSEDYRERYHPEVGFLFDYRPDHEAGGLGCDRQEIYYHLDETLVLLVVPGEEA